EGPWQVHVMTALPLKALSRLFGAFNDLTIPVFLRVPSLRFYSWVFGCDLTEMQEPDLRTYRNLGDFFYRELAPGARPVAKDASLVSPSDGRVLNFGVIKGRAVESVKGLTYNLDAFLGLAPPPRRTTTTTTAEGVSRSSSIVNDEEFAQVNGITYSLENLVGGENQADASGQPIIDSASSTQQQQQQHIGGGGPPVIPGSDGRQLRPGHELYFCVIYLAPGDYHRFHSPTHWVVENRRHFAGELYSVSPYVLRMIRDLFVLNERVALLGRWRHGFMAMIPVGATNVGSIQIAFDPVLKTNTHAEIVPDGQRYREVSYRQGSPLLQGVPLGAGEEMGGFRLGSTVVLVFEAPQTFRFAIEPEQKIRMGEPLGYVQPTPIA
ncbi:phosphatidylserine decarboxylase-domain-containing protein, partial [Dimargaris cristalligena]